MKLLLLLISITLLSTSASTCNKSGSAESTATTPDSLATKTDTMTIDTAVTAGNPQTPSSTPDSSDAINRVTAKEEKAQSASGKNEAPQHNSPNQEKIDSIKASKKKNKNQ